METIDGTAEAESDYIPYKETLVFEPGETSKSIEIKIVDDNEWEPDEVFFVKLGTVDPEENCVIGRRAITQVTILNDDSKYDSGLCAEFCFFKILLFSFPPHFSSVFTV